VRLETDNSLVLEQLMGRACCVVMLVRPHPVPANWFGVTECHSGRLDVQNGMRSRWDTVI